MTESERDLLMQYVMEFVDAELVSLKELDTDS